MSDNAQTKNMMKQVHLIEKVSNYINDKLNNMTSKSGLTNVINRNKSRKRTASNLSVKINRKTRRLNKNNFIFTDVNVLADMIEVTHRNNPNTMKPCKPKKTKLVKSTGLV